MFTIEFSMLGTAIAILLILISMFIMYVYTPNLKYQFKKINSNMGTSAARNAKNIIKSKQDKIHLTVWKNYYQKQIDLKRNILRLKPDTFNDTAIYGEVNSTFYAYKYLLTIKRANYLDRHLTIFKVLNSLMAINLIWTLITSFWILVAILSIILVLLSLIIIINEITIDSRAKKLAWEKMKLISTKETIYATSSYLKYKKLSSLWSALTIFFEPFVSGYKIFKEWGADD